MAYAEKSDIEDVFGADNVAAWSNLNGDTIAADDDRIDKALIVAEAYVNDRFRGSQYVIPFPSVPVIVIDWTAKLAGCWLYESRGRHDTTESNRLAEMKSEMLGDMAEYLSNSKRFDAVLEGQSGMNAPMVVTDALMRQAGVW